MIRAVDWVVALVLLAPLGCDQVSPPTDEDGAELESAPESVTVAGKTLVLYADLWRDFMPISPPHGKPLIGLFYITVGDSTEYPAKWKPDAVWLLHGEEPWLGGFTGEEPPGDLVRPYRDIATVRAGPQYGPGVAVDVVVRLVGPGGETRLLKGSDQWIHRTQ